MDRRLASRPFRTPVAGVRGTSVAIALVGMSVAAAACGGSSPSSSAGTTTTSASRPAPGSAPVAASTPRTGGTGGTPGTGGTGGGSLCTAIFGAPSAVAAEFAAAQPLVLLSSGGDSNGLECYYAVSGASSPELGLLVGPHVSASAPASGHAANGVTASALPISASGVTVGPSEDGWLAQAAARDKPGSA